jgi:hypothetical protein
MRFLKWFGYLVGASALVSVLLIGADFAVVALSSNPTVAGWRGEQDARRDVSRGLYRQISSGLPAEWALNYRREMAARYNVDIAPGGCIVTRGMREYALAYNKVSADSAIRHFGHDIFKETALQAQADWDRTARDAR